MIQDFSNMSSFQEQIQRETSSRGKGAYFDLFRGIAPGPNDSKDISQTEADSTVIFPNAKVESANGARQVYSTPPSQEEISSDITRLVQRATETVEREVQRILGMVQGECVRLIQEAEERALEILIVAEDDAGRIRRAAAQEGARLNAEAEKKAEQACIVTKQAEEALCVIESACRALRAMDVVLSQPVHRQVNTGDADATRMDFVQQISHSTSESKPRVYPVEPSQESPSPTNGIIECYPEDSSEAAGPRPVVADHQGTSSITLVVSPFGSFRSLTAFQTAIEGLEGVRSAKIQRFHKGTLYQLVQYSGVIPLEERLKELTRFKPQVVASSNGSIELRIDPGDNRILQASTPD